MAKKSTQAIIFEPMPYQGTVRSDFLSAAKQSSSFLNDRQTLGEFGSDMLKADLIATGNYAIQNEIGGRAIAARIADESARLFGNDVHSWFK